MDTYSLFPFDKVPRGSRFVIYGAGKIGEGFIKQIKSVKWGSIILADRRWDKLSNVSGVPVLPPSEIKSKDYEYIVVAAQKRFFDSISQDLNALGVDNDKVVFPKNHIKLPGVADATAASPWGRLSNSYHAEDFVVLYTFKALGISKPNYIDVGANDPYAASNTALMYKYGSRGINIEANPDLIDAFRRARPEDINLNVGVGPQAGTSQFYVINETGGTSTFSLAQAKAEEEAGKKITSVIDVEISTLDSVVEEYANGVYPDYLDIDIEGLDYDVLKSCNFSEHTPKIICCEVKDNHPLEEMNAMMDEKGYELYVILSDDAIYLKKGLKGQLKILP